MKIFFESWQTALCLANSSERIFPFSFPQNAEKHPLAASERHSFRKFNRLRKNEMRKSEAILIGKARNGTPKKFPFIDLPQAQRRDISATTR